MSKRRRVVTINQRMAAARRWLARSIDPTVYTLEEELKNVAELARIDPLTGAGNRRDWDGLCARREADPAEAFIVVDLNDFKQINDQYGHNIGDLTLVYVSRVIARVLVKFELSARERFFRIGGDEFVVITPVEIAQQLMGSLDAVVNLGGRDGEFAKVPDELTVSFGLGATFDAADRNMYELKEARKRSSSGNRPRR